MALPDVRFRPRAGATPVGHSRMHRGRSAGGALLMSPLSLSVHGPLSVCRARLTSGSGRRFTVGNFDQTAAESMEVGHHQGHRPTYCSPPTSAAPWPEGP